MIALVWLALTAGVDDDAVSLTLVFEKMHCDECKAEVEARVRKLPGFKSVAFEEDSARVLLDEASPIPAVGTFPKDLSLKTQRLSLRGVVNASGDKLTLIAKGSGTALGLANPERPRADRLSELRQALGGQNRFRVTGLLSGRTLVLESFEKTDWR